MKYEYILFMLICDELCHYYVSYGHFQWVEKPVESI